jgi:heme exporter protein D
MNGIGNAFIWAAIGCGPVFLVILGLATVVQMRRTPRANAIAQPKRPAPARRAARR